MISSLCKENEHDTCPKLLRLPPGKIFSCACGCHPLPVKVERVIIEEDDDD